MPAAEQEPGAFRELMERVREGSADATQQFVEEYGKHVTRFVRRYRASELRSKFDVEDYVQEVWTAFFHKLPGLHFQHPQVLLAFLYRLTHNQVLTMNVHFLQTQKNNVRREVSLEDPSLDRQTLVSPDAPPGRRAECQDEIAWLLKSCRPLGQEIVRQIQNGYSQKEAARALCVAEKTVGRFLHTLRLRAGQAAL